MDIADTNGHSGLRDPGAAVNDRGAGHHNLEMITVRTMSPRKATAVLLCAALGLLAGVTPAQATPAGESAHCPQLDPGLPWHGDNRAKLQRMIDERGRCAGKPGPRPVAVFDWDNTVIKNDITDATLAWALKHDKILRPQNWTSTSKWLSPAADQALTAACGTSTPVGRPLPTSTNTACTDEIMEIRERSRTMGGAAAFVGDWNHRRTEPSYVWVPNLFAGHTPATLKSFARKARAEQLSAPIGAKQTVGTHTIAGYIRYYDQQQDLIRTLRWAGFEVYIVSASAEPIAEAWSGGVGVSRSHTIGIRNQIRHGRLTTESLGCGDDPDALPYIDGKRCLVNQEIFGVRGKAAWNQQDPAHRIALGAGDADTDVTFVADATGAHLALNRNKPELMCRAYDNADGRWLPNPMFIDPMPVKTGPYPCSTAGAVHPDGTRGPLLRADGTVVPDQQDR
ncbi:MULTISPECIES: haloacid dehalogenase-like hydrolase [unclassified Crossiella]|uniref:haloacid dehalogenase-like hydrolase n=1 Tax=unclassified Crossiella TaxID=2620835 RepID=UPI001FFEA7E7|nr:MULTISPECIES: haloacid dehalogenase-like hydrolase [unclassified Crossiella]MCK2239303.1 haloacid dehalogenase-like hydrolase [Crossiella sp. S99.2]MCK2251127.1 haloacid dehalogenase-like hydrolase [Crossiella sp. S99.1]